MTFLTWGSYSKKMTIRKLAEKSQNGQRIAGWYADRGVILCTDLHGWLPGGPFRAKDGDIMTIFGIGPMWPALCKVIGVVWHSIVLAFAGVPGFHPPIASLIFAFCVDVAGFFSGIIGLTSHKKRVATAGIVLCSLPIILVILVKILAHPFFW